MKSRFFTLLLLLTMVSSGIIAQEWVDQANSSNPNFYDIQSSFNDYWSVRDSSVKGKGWKPYKRWEWFVEPRVYPSGDLSVMNRAMESYFKTKLAEQTVMKPKLGGPWSYIGNTSIPYNGGAGRVNFIRFMPGNTNVCFIGAPGGGLWKSTNGGSSWSNWNTDLLAVIGCSDLAIDPNNTNVMYLATGDGDGSDTYSVGVLKTTDGGMTWVSTGLNWSVTQNRLVRKLIIDPTNSNVLIAATSNGVYKSTDAGATWSQTATGSFYDVEFMPGNTTVVYASTDVVYKSTNGGNSFSAVSGNPSASSVRRASLAVTAANPNYLYVLFSDNSGAFYGVYKSTNGGSSISLAANSPNLLGYDANGGDTGGQGWYDLTIAASPVNANFVVVGGVNVWTSSNGGSSWSVNTHWYGNGAPYIHADQHDIQFVPGTGTYYACNDGGVFNTTNNGSNWSDLSNGLQIGQIYRLSNAVTNANKVIMGWQDNGTNLKNNSTFTRVIGGDGMECIISSTNENVMYGALYYGDIRRTTNGSTFSSIVSSGGTGVNANGNWVTPYVMSPSNSSELIVGKANLYKSTNTGTSWSALGSTSGGTGNFVAIAYAPSNTNVIYAAKKDALYKSTNGGTSFTNVTSGLPTSSALITYIAVSGSDPNRVYVTFSGYSSANKIFLSTDGGSSWTNYTSGLPNLPANCVEYENGSNDAVYVGTDVGVYYRNATMSSFASFSSGLPNVVVNELKIHYGSNKLRAATFGRGLWETSLYVPNTPPVADFSGSPTDICSGNQVQLSDLSTNGPTSWSWTITPSTGVTYVGGTSAASQNPIVQFNTNGVYDVTLTSSNSFGSDTETKTAYINVGANAQPLPFSEGFEGATLTSSGWVNNDALNDGVTWVQTSTAGGYGNSSKSANFDNYNNDTRGGIYDELISPRLDFSAAGTYKMTFDVAYVPYNTTYSDTLVVLVSADCGVTYQSVYVKGGANLSTSASSTSAFVPTSTQWRTDTIDLSSYAGNPDLMVKFRNIGGYGNNMYIDNINISTVVSTNAPVATFTAAPSICEGDCIQLQDASTGGTPTSWNWTIPGGDITSSQQQNPGQVCFLNAGNYTIQLDASNAGGTSSFTQTVQVNASPILVASAQNTTLCNGTSTNVQASGATSYVWSPSTGLGSTTSASTSAAPSTSTNYLVVGTNAQGCSDSATVTINVVQTNQVALQASTLSLCNGGSSTLSASGSSTYQWSPATGLNATTGASVIANPGSTTTYYVDATDANGCLSVDSVTIQVGSSILVTANATYDTICSGDATTLTANGGNTYTWSPGSSLSSTSGNAVIANPPVSTTYTVIGSNGGCSDTVQLFIAVYPGTQVNLTASDTTLCLGESAILSASGSNSYTWSPSTGLNIAIGNTVTATPTSTTTYRVTGSTIYGCIDEKDVTLTVNPLPVVALTLPNDTICMDTVPYLLTGGSPLGGSFSGTNISGNYFYSNNSPSGVYVVNYDYVDSKGCAASANDQFYLTNCNFASINESLHEVVMVYPNPMNDVLVLERKITGDELQLSIYDNLGRLVISDNLYKEENYKNISVQTLVSGVYYLSIKGGDKEVVIKLVK